MTANIYLKFTGPEIRGSASDPGHAGEIELLSWSHGFSQPTLPPGRAGPGTVEQASHQYLTVAKYVDAASAELIKLCWSGRQIQKALLRCYRSDADNAPICYLEIELAHVIIANISLGGGPGDLPTETIALDYGVVTYRYRAPGAGRNGADAVDQVSHDLVQQMVS